MSFLIILLSLGLLMFVAYRGLSVILFAPVCALLAVLLTDPSLVPPLFSGIFMDKLVGFVQLYFPVFLLGAVFGKVIELSGFSKSIVAAVIGPAFPPTVWRLSAGSSTTPRLESCWQIIRRIGSEFSPMPPVSTIASSGGRTAK